jgi:translocation and assembly module TamB
VIFLVLLIALLALIAWITSTSSGARASFRWLNLMTAGQIQASDIHGSFAHQLQIGNLNLRSQEGQITISDLQLNWQPQALRHRSLHVDALRIGELVIQTSKPAEREPLRLPASLQLPLQVSLEHVHIDRLSIRQGDQAQATVTALRLHWHFDHDTLVLGVQSAHLTQLGSQRIDGHLKAKLNLQASQPYAIQGDIQLQGQQDQWRGASEASIRGQLADMTAQLLFRFGQHPLQTQLSGHVQLQPFSTQPIGAGEFKAAQLDLASLHSAWPKTRIDAQVTLTSQHKGKFDLRNTLPGTLDKSRLPVNQASGNISLRDNHLAIEAIQINQNTLTGNIKRQRGQWQFDFQMQRLNLKKIDSRMRATQLDGHAHLAQQADHTTLQIALSEPVNSRPLRIHAEASLEKSLLTVKSAQLSLGKAVADLSGQVLLSGLQTFDARGRVQGMRLADLGKFEQLPDILLNGRFDLKGQRYPGLQAALDFSLVDSRIDRHPVNGEGKIQLDLASLRIPGLVLRVGDNRLQVHGALDEHQGELNLKIEAAQLSQLGPAFAGQLTMTGKVSGQLKQPAFVANWHAQSLRLPGKLSVRDTRGQVQLGLAAQSPLALQVSFKEAVFASTALPSLQIDLEGKPEAHTLSVRLTNDTSRLHLSATGGVDAISPQGTWRGQLRQATIKGEINAVLEQSAAVEWSQEYLQLSHLHLSGDFGRFVIAHLRRDSQGIVSRGSIEKLHIGQLAATAKFAPILQSDLQLDGNWNLSLPKQGHQQSQGLIELRRTHGDLRFSGTPAIALQLQQLEAKAELSEGRLSFRLKARGDQLGTLIFAGGTRLRDGQLIPQATAPIDGVLNASLPALNFMGPLLSSGLITAGKMDAQISVTGSLSSPALAGTISAERLNLQWLDNGLALTDGRLQADFNGDLLQVRQLSFAGSRDSTGRISVTGPIRFIRGRPESDLNWRATQFSLFDQSDRQLVLTGSGQLQTLARNARLRGELMLDRGFFDLGREEMPQLSDDVIVTGSRIAGGERIAPVETVARETVAAAGIADAPSIERRVGTVFFVSPPDAPLGSMPDQSWSPYVRQDLTYNRVLAYRTALDQLPRLNLSLVTGLAGGIADPIFAGLLAPINEADALASLQLSQASVRIEEWTL